MEAQLLLNGVCQVEIYAGLLVINVPALDAVIIP